jgi:hypothetical protein
MIPAKNDPKWIKFTRGLSTIQAANLPTRMMLSRLKLKLGNNPTDALRQEVIASAWDFFTKNQASVADDIQKIFA